MDDDRLMRGGPGSRAGFTLVELLVVIAIIALLIGILLPTLGKARRAARGAVGLSNMRTLSQLIFVYTNDHRDEWLNPFDPDKAPWHGVALPEWEGANWGYFHARRATEVWGTQAVSLLMHYAEGNNGSMFSDVIYHPSDRVGIARLREHLAGTEGYDHFIWDSSYWYPPTYWVDGSRYETDELVPVTRDLLRRNRVAHVSFPSSKALLFERFDFTVDRRPAASGGTAAHHPQFNNPAGTTRFVTADGGVGSVEVAEVAALMESPKDSVSRSFTPSGVWDPGLGMFRHWGMDGDPFENGDNDTIAHPAWFWATRDGLRGRDVYGR